MKAGQASGGQRPDNGQKTRRMRASELIASYLASRPMLTQSGCACPRNLFKALLRYPHSRPACACVHVSQRTRVCFLTQHLTRRYATDSLPWKPLAAGWSTWGATSCRPARHTADGGERGLPAGSLEASPPRKASLIALYKGVSSKDEILEWKHFLLFCFLAQKFVAPAPVTAALKALFLHRHGSAPSRSKPSACRQ